MTAWSAAASVLLLLLVPCTLVAMRGGPLDRLLGLELGGTIAALTLIVLAEGFGRSIYADVALVYAVLSFTGTLVFIRFLERWV
jgi:multicomponent Na+:H+ antiporter subunit F